MLCVCVLACMHVCNIIYVYICVGGLAHSWTRYFCQFSKSEDVQFLRLIPLGQHNKVPYI